MSIFSVFRFKRKISNKIFGNIGEDIAKNFLSNNNYKILTTNFSCHGGEIDIIARKNNVVAFVEVKTRSSTAFGRPEEAVNSTKQRRISKAARYYLFQNNFPANTSFRADIVSILLSDGNPPEINHFINAFPLV